MRAPNKPPNDLRENIVETSLNSSPTKSWRSSSVGPRTESEIPQQKKVNQRRNVWKDRDSSESVFLKFWIFLPWTGGSMDRKRSVLTLFVTYFSGEMFTTTRNVEQICGKMSISYNIIIIHRAEICPATSPIQSTAELRASQRSLTISIINRRGS